MTTVIRLAGLPGSWKWRMEVDAQRMSLVVPALREPLVVPLAHIAAVYNPTTGKAGMIEQSYALAPSRAIVGPILYQPIPAFPVTLGVIFRTPQRCPPKSVRWRLPHWFSLEARATHLDGFEVAVSDWEQARDAFAAVGVFEATNVAALFIETVGGVRRSSAEQDRLRRRNLRAKIFFYALRVILGLSIVLFLWWRGWSI